MESTNEKTKEWEIFKEFQVPRCKDVEMFQTFLDEVEFGDCSFTSIYAWQQGKLQYTYKTYKDIIAVLERDIDGTLAVMLLHKKNTDITLVVKNLYEMFYKLQRTLRFKYVSECEFDIYRKAAWEIGKSTVFDNNVNSNDYIYETAEFLSLTGNSNKGKRGGLNHLMREYPDISMVSHSHNRDLLEPAIEVFDSWCKKHKCENCVYGCEKKAFLRFMEVFDEKKHRLCMAYSNGKPLSFAASERIRTDTVCYYFQKNAVPTRGLTYWLNREMALEHAKIKYINLGEDMGLSGLREDKTSLHPCFIKPKYSVEIL